MCDWGTSLGSATPHTMRNCAFKDLALQNTLLEERVNQLLAEHKALQLKVAEIDGSSVKLRPIKATTGKKTEN